MNYYKAVHLDDAFSKWLQDCEKHILIHLIIMKEALILPYAEWITCVK